MTSVSILPAKKSPGMYEVTFCKQGLHLYTNICEYDYVCSEMARTEVQFSTYAKALEEAQRDKTHLERQLEVEKMRVDTERRKLLLAQDALSEKVSCIHLSHDP